MATGYEDTTNEDAVIDEIDDVDFIEPEEIVEDVEETDGDVVSDMLGADVGLGGFS